MDLAGQTHFRVPPERLAEALRDPEMLRQMIPGCTAVTRTSSTTYKAKIEKDTGPVTLRMTAEVSVEPLDDGQYLLRVKGRNALAGSVLADVTLTLVPALGGTVVGHSCRLTATGLAGRLLDGRDQMLASGADGMFGALRRAIEVPEPGPAG